MKMKTLCFENRRRDTKNRAKKNRVAAPKKCMMLTEERSRIGKFNSRVFPVMGEVDVLHGKIINIKYFQQPYAFHSRAALYRSYMHCSILLLLQLNQPFSWPRSVPLSTTLSSPWTPGVQPLGNP